jgi:hypothetical protein
MVKDFKNWYVSGFYDGINCLAEFRGDDGVYFHFSDTKTYTIEHLKQKIYQGIWFNSEARFIFDKYCSL